MDDRDLERFDALGGNTERNLTAFRASRWFKRGWTLQELLAPSSVLFYCKDGDDCTYIGTRENLSAQISDATGIGEEYLKDYTPEQTVADHLKNEARQQTIRRIQSASVARRMSWAAEREKTTRPEDTAYSLLGIFGVNMPLLYGEGKARAFTRLQLAIIAQSDDDSIFAWDVRFPGDRDDARAPPPRDGHPYDASTPLLESGQVDNGSSRKEDPHYGMLARSPEQFKRSRDILNGPDQGLAATQATMNAVVHTSMMSVQAAISACFSGVHRPSHDVIRLKCTWQSDKKGRHGRHALWLTVKRAPDGRFYRTNLAAHSTYGIHWLGNALQDLIGQSKQLSISSRPYIDVAHEFGGRSTPLWESKLVSSILRAVFTLRNVAIVLVVLIGVVGQTTCSAGTSNCDAAILVTLFLFLLRDLLRNWVQFWMVMILWLFLSGRGGVRFKGS
ncbi:hypothetical protein LTR85_000952 [Meristemomyces frigidus]|nr:hypothetical protein LTR85_000952 [Meristemomyces frigidus]